MSYWDDFDPCDSCPGDDCDECWTREWREEVADRQREDAISEGKDPIIFSEDLME
jgi:hypothetical protein